MTDAAFDLKGRRVWVAGHAGMVGAALCRRLGAEDCEIVTIDRAAVDLRRQADVEDWMEDTRPAAVFLAAATVGGILANDTRPADFLYDNLAIEGNVIQAAHKTGVEKLLLLGSSCIYPREAPQPMSEDALLTGPLEPTNEWYAVAKIAGIKLCQAYRRQHGCDFIAAMPTNLYGPGDNFDLATSHVVPALMAKAHRAKADGAAEIEIWGSGKPRREFLYVDDAADALDLTIDALARMICEVVGYDGECRYDASKPDGTPRKLLDVGRLSALGWTASTPLRTGLAQTYDWYKAQCAV
jgi:GDP-L-fucose synthase